MQWEHHVFWFWPIGFIFFWVIVAVIASRIFYFRNNKGCWRARQFDEAEVLLRRRLVSGEIDEEQYRKLKEVLKNEW